MLEKSEADQLEKAWRIIKIIWGALFFSLAVYLLVCKVVENQLKPLTVDFPLEVLKTILFGVSVLTLLITYYVRKAMLKVSAGGAASTFVQNPSLQIQSPAAGKYMTAIIVAMALSESIGIYGMVLFFLSKDSTALYEFIALSAIAMLYYGPRKEELFQLAAEMQQKPGGRQV